MANKRPKPEGIVWKLRQVEVLMGQGMSRLDAIRQIGVVEQTYYRWRKKYGGMAVGPLKSWLGMPLVLTVQCWLSAEISISELNRCWRVTSSTEAEYTPA